jgi:hypothetical protein
MHALPEILVPHTDDEKQITRLSEESSGRIWLPETFEEMIDDDAKAARLIDLQLVVTYKPRRAMASAVKVRFAALRSLHEESV